MTTLSEPPHVPVKAGGHGTDAFAPGGQHAADLGGGKLPYNGPVGKENRIFKRYPRQWAVRVRLGQDDHPAEITDYSLDGVGVVVPGSVPIRIGDRLTVDTDVADLADRYRAVWLAPTGERLRAGLHRMGQLRGSLADYRLADILIGLQRSVKTGVLSIRHNEAEKRIYLRRGDPVFASSNLMDDRLGEMLLREGKISREVFDRASELLRTGGGKLGAALVGMGVTPPRELFMAVKRQTAGIILSVFSLPGGSTFLLQEGDLPAGEIIPLNLSAANLIYRGMKLPTCTDQIRDYLDLPASTPIYLSRDPLDLFQDIDLDPEDRQVLSLVDGTRTVGDIVAQAGGSQEQVRRILGALLSTSILEVPSFEVKDAPPDMPAVSGPEYAAFADGARREAAPLFLERIESMHRGLDSMDHYEVLGVERTAQGPAVQTAFWRLARDFHPDRHLGVDGDVKEKLTAIFARMSHAFSDLSQPSRRREYDQSLVARKRALPPEEQARQLYEQGLAALSGGNPAAAERRFAQALFLDPGPTRYHLAHARSLAGLDRGKEAARVLERALEVDPGSDEILTELGGVYLDLGFPLRARKNFEQALGFNPANERARQGLLAARFGTGRGGGPTGGGR